MCQKDSRAHVCNNALYDDLIKTAMVRLEFWGWTCSVLGWLFASHCFTVMSAAADIEESNNYCVPTG